MSQHHLGSLLVEFVEMGFFGGTGIILQEFPVKLIIRLLTLGEAFLELASLKVKSLKKGSKGIPSIIPFLGSFLVAISSPFELCANFDFLVAEFKALFTRMTSLFKLFKQTGHSWRSI